MLSNGEKFVALHTAKSYAYFLLYTYFRGVAILTELLPLTAGKEAHRYKDCASPCRHGETVLRRGTGGGHSEAGPARLRVPQHAGQQSSRPAQRKAGSRLSG